MVALTPVTNNKHCLMAPVQTEVQAQTSELAAAIESPFHTGSDEWFRHQENRAVTRRQMRAAFPSNVSICVFLSE